MLIGILGRAGAGKDTIADYLVANYGFQKESFASSLKDATSAIFGWDREMLEGSTPESRAQREQKDEFWSEKLGKDITPRIMLQQLGTNVLRQQFYDGIWIASLEYKLMNTTKDIVISDVRFPNEVKLIQRLGGQLIEVFRDEDPEWSIVASQANEGDKDALKRMQTEFKHIHESEWSWAGTKADIKIDNTGTYDELFAQVETYVKEPSLSQT